ncbi:MAG: SURF1 family protein [Rickettsiales bacterium]|nr:SURF1 family protein [Rickettsiales bacterium]
MPSFVRPRPVAWFFFLAAFGTCLALGTWQVERLKWKEGIIAALAEANADATLTALPVDEAELKPLQFRKITLKGTWQGDTEFHLAPRYWRDKFGYAIITPFKLGDDRVVMVNRGWVPAKKKEASTRPETAVKGPATINGLVRVGAERNYMSPPNQPEKNIWFGRDVSAMAASANIKNIVPAMVDIVGVQDVKNLPVPSDGTIRLKNDHLSYILTWYGIALGILVIFVVYHRKK